MFHCKIGLYNIVLFESQVREIVYEITGDAIYSFSYNMESREAKKDMKKVYTMVVNYLSDIQLKDPEKFRYTYIYHYKKGIDALFTFFLLMDSYRRIMNYVNCDDIDNFDELSVLPGGLSDYNPPEFINISILSAHGFMEKLRKTIAVIEIPTNSIQEIEGRSEDFFLCTTHNTIRFTYEGVFIEQPSK